MRSADHTTRIWAVPEARRFQSLWFGVGLIALCVGIGPAFLYLVPPNDDATAMSASFIPYGLPVDLIAVIFLGIALVRARRRLAIAVLTLAGAILLALQVIWIGPQFVPDPRPQTTPAFTMISLNMKWGGADPTQLRNEAASADLIVLVEVTPAAFPSIRTALGSRFPYTVPSAITTANESMILSRYPLTDASPLRSTNQQWTAATTMPGIGRLNVIAAHPCNPQCGEQRWSKEHTALLQRAEQLDSAPEIIAGDFNATDDHGPMRDMYARGFVSATDITGAGWMPTFPSDMHLVPPAIEIDHVLVNSRLTALSIKTFRITGTDHFGLIARLAGS